MLTARAENFIRERPDLDDGTSMVRLALATVLNAARGVVERGDCAFVDGLPSVSDFNRLIDPE